MREIKFRAWDKETKQMIYISQMAMSNKIDEIYGIEFTKDGGNIYNKSGIELEDVTVMQYTGLKDKNGVEIYEGDIVKFIYNSTPQQEIIGQVKWRDDYLAWGFGSYLIEPTPKKTIEIIGNIYENPELLNKTV